MKSVPAWRTRLYFLSTLLVVIAFAASGFANLFHAPHVANDMRHLGYPPYFSTVLGTWKVLGAVAVAWPGLPRLKEWAYAGMVFDLTGAAWSRFALGDSVAMVAVPLFILGLVVLSWAWRPVERTLSGSWSGKAEWGPVMRCVESNGPSTEIAGGAQP